MNLEIYLDEVYRRVGYDTALYYLNPDEIRRAFTYYPGGRLLAPDVGRFGPRREYVSRTSSKSGPWTGLIRIGNVTLPEALLVWVYHDGALPMSYVTFMDRRRSNSRVENLEDASGRTPKRYIPEGQ